MTKLNKILSNQVLLFIKKTLKAMLNFLRLTKRFKNLSNYLRSIQIVYHKSSPLMALLYI